MFFGKLLLDLVRERKALVLMILGVACSQSADREPAHNIDYEDDDQPRIRVQPRPGDRQTSVGTEVEPGAFVDFGWLTVTQADVDAVASRMRLATWPELTPVPVSVRAVAGNGVGDVVLDPVQALSDRWYVLLFEELPPRFVIAADSVATTPLGQGVRFRVGSEIVVSDIRVCREPQSEEFPAEDFVSFTFSESVQFEGRIDESIRLRVNGVDFGCTEPAPGGAVNRLVVVCPPFADNTTMAVEFRAGIRSLGGIPFAPRTVPLGTVPISDGCYVVPLTD